MDVALKRKMLEQPAFSRAVLAGPNVLQELGSLAAVDLRPKQQRRRLLDRGVHNGQLRRSQQV